MNHIEQHSADYYAKEKAALSVLLTGTGIAYVCLYTMAFLKENFFAVKIFTVEAILIAAAVVVVKKLL